MIQNRYPIRAVAKITGLSLDTLRAWERRYQAVVPERSSRGRQYGAKQIERLVLLNRLVQGGHAIGGIASLTDPELKHLLTRQPGRPASEAAPPADLLAPLLSAIESFDAARAADELGWLAAVLSPRDLIYKVAAPLMREVGIRWHKGTFAIAQEHLVSHMMRTLFGSMIRQFRPLNPAIKTVLATPAGDAHEFGILVSAMLMSMAGIEPVYLGPDLPAREIGAAAQRVSARVVVLGITLITETSQAEIRSIAASMPEAAELWVGGSRSAELDLAKLGRKTILLKDFAALESECLRWRN